jgi:hypothetical protein
MVPHKYGNEGWLLRCCGIIGKGMEVYERGWQPQWYSSGEPWKIAKVKNVADEATKEN